LHQVKLRPERRNANLRIVRAAGAILEAGNRRDRPGAEQAHHRYHYACFKHGQVVVDVLRFGARSGPHPGAAKYATVDPPLE
jgi:hypothetical protein